MRKEWSAVLVALSLLTLTLDSLSADPLIKVCDSSQYKRVVEDTCSSVYKRGRHSKIIFNSYGVYRSRSKRKSALALASRDH